MGGGRQRGIGALGLGPEMSVLFRPRAEALHGREADAFGAEGPLRFAPLDECGGPVL